MSVESALSGLVNVALAVAAAYLGRLQIQQRRQAKVEQEAKAIVDRERDDRRKRLEALEAAVRSQAGIGKSIDALRVTVEALQAKCGEWEGTCHNRRGEIFERLSLVETDLQVLTARWDDGHKSVVAELKALRDTLEKSTRRKTP